MTTYTLDMADGTLKNQIQSSGLYDSQKGILQIQGWVQRIQKFRKHSFVWIRDLTFKTTWQVVYQAEVNFVDEAYVTVTGKIVPVKAGQSSPNGVEIVDASIAVGNPSTEGFSAIVPKAASSDVKLANRHLYLRDTEFAAITRFRDLTVRSIRHAFSKTSMVEIYPPSFVGNACEGGATLFELEHPGSSGMMKAYLTQSSQFYLEMAVPGLGDCFCISPSFRKEKSHTRRHLTEFLHAECEWHNVNSLEEHEAHLEDMLKSILDYLIRKTQSAPTLYPNGINERLVKLRAMCDDILRLDHADAVVMCNDMGGKLDGSGPFAADEDIPEAEERRLIDKLGKIVFLRKFPGVFKSFYMKPDPQNPKLVWGVDVEVPGVGEVVGSGVREADYDKLLAAMLAQGLKPEEYAEYLDLRRYGSGNTSGMGLGVDRLITWLLDKFSIRDVVTFPRYPGRLTP